MLFILLDSIIVLRLLSLSAGSWVTVSMSSNESKSSPSSPTIVVHPPVQAAGPRAVPDQQQRVQSSQDVDLSQEHPLPLSLYESLPLADKIASLTNPYTVVERGWT